MIATGIIRRIDDLGRIVIPREIRKKYTLRKGDFWEELIAPSGKMICGNHRLNATEILDALDIQYTEEELESDEEED